MSDCTTDSKRSYLYFPCLNVLPFPALTPSNNIFTVIVQYVYCCQCWTCAICINNSFLVNLYLYSIEPGWRKKVSVFALQLPLCYRSQSQTSPICKRSNTLSQHVLPYMSVSRCYAMQELLVRSCASLVQSAMTTARQDSDLIFSSNFLHLSLAFSSTQTLPNHGSFHVEATHSPIITHRSCLPY